MLSPRLLWCTCHTVFSSEGKLLQENGRKFIVSASGSRSLRRLIFFPCRVIRRKEVLAWHGDSVKGIRKKINTRAYIFLITYTLVVVWINLCYVVTYDTPTIWYADTYSLFKSLDVDIRW